MWNLDKQSRADFLIGHWRLRVVCQLEGVQLIATHQSSAASAGSISLLDDHLPALAESFVRGDELHLSMPPTPTSEAGLAVVLLVVQADQDCLVVESTLSIETLLLDAYPAVVLGLPGEGPLTSYTDVSARVFTRECSSNEPGPSNRPPLSVLVDQRDQRSLDVSGESDPSLRFFADFMEKGVIRKTQPWWVWSSATAHPTKVRQLVTELAQRPLPLAN